MAADVFLPLNEESVNWQWMLHYCVLASFSQHLGAVPPESGDFHEMVCQACMNHCHFLWAYVSQLAGKES